MRLLVVTDHMSHNETNSVYSLCRALLKDDRQPEVWTCSRGIPQNAEFFKGKKDALFYATRVSSTYAFDPIPAESIDGILVRMPQPLNANFLRSLELIVPLEKIINRPSGIIETSSKAYLLELSDLCSEPEICNSIEHALAMSRDKEIVLKPMYSYGGKGIIRISHDHCWNENECCSIDQLQQFASPSQFPMVSFRFLKNVTQGDKRTIIVNKQILGSALRLPAPGSWLCNVAQGGHAVISEMDEDEILLEKFLTPLLFQKGIILYGFDTLVNDEGKRVLSEINTLSIGGLQFMEEMTGEPVVQQAAASILDYIDGV